MRGQHGAHPSAGAIGYDTFLALCQARNVRIVVFHPVTGDRDALIDTDLPGQWQRLWDEVMVVQNIFLNKAEVTSERQGAETVQVLMGPSHEAAPLLFEPTSGEWTRVEEVELLQIMAEKNRPFSRYWTREDLAKELQQRAIARGLSTAILHSPQTLYKRICALEGKPRREDGKE